MCWGEKMQISIYVGICVAMEILLHVPHLIFLGPYEVAKPNSDPNHEEITTQKPGLLVPSPVLSCYEYVLAVSAEDSNVSGVDTHVKTELFTIRILFATSAMIRVLFVTFGFPVLYVCILRCIYKFSNKESNSLTSTWENNNIQPRNSNTIRFGKLYIRSAFFLIFVLVATGCMAYSCYMRFADVENFEHHSRMGKVFAGLLVLGLIIMQLYLILRDRRNLKKVQQSTLALDESKLFRGDGSCMSIDANSQRLSILNQEESCGTKNSIEKDNDEDMDCRNSTLNKKPSNEHSSFSERPSILLCSSDETNIASSELPVILNGNSTSNIHEQTSTSKRPKTATGSRTRTASVTREKSPQDHLILTSENANCIFFSPEHQPLQQNNYITSSCSPSSPEELNSRSDTNFSSSNLSSSSSIVQHFPNGEL